MNPTSAATDSNQNAAFLNPAAYRFRRRWSLWGSSILGLLLGFSCVYGLTNVISPLAEYNRDTQIKLHPGTVNATVTNKNTEPPITRNPVNHVSYRFTIDGRVFERTDVIVDDATYASLGRTIPVKYDTTNPANFTNDPLLTSVGAVLILAVLYYGFFVVFLGGAAVILLYYVIHAWRRTPPPSPFDPTAPVVPVPAGQYPEAAFAATIGGMAYSQNMGILEFKDGYLSFEVNDAVVFRFAYTQIDHVKLHAIGSLTIRAGDNEYWLSLGGVTSTAGVMRQLGNQLIPAIGLRKTLSAHNAAVTEEYELMRALSPYVRVSGRPHISNAKLVNAICLILAGIIFVDVQLHDPIGPAIPGAIGIVVVFCGAALWLFVSWYRANRQLQRHGLNLDTNTGAIAGK